MACSGNIIQHEDSFYGQKLKIEFINNIDDNNTDSPIKYSAFFKIINLLYTQNIDIVYTKSMNDLEYGKKYYMNLAVISNVANQRDGIFRVEMITDNEDCLEKIMDLNITEYPYLNSGGCFKIIEFSKDIDGEECDDFFRMSPMKYYNPDHDYFIK